MFQLRSISKKALLSLGAVGVAASMAGLGTFATFNDSTSASQAVSSGTVDINLGAAGTADNRLTIGATGLVPGDTVQRRAKVSNAGSENLASVVLTTVDTTTDPDTVLTTDAINGLQVKIERCTGALGWKESATPYTYTCDATLAGDNAGVRSVVLASRAVIGSNMALSGMQALTAGNTDDMVVTLSLPSTADNTFQNKSATVEYTFTGTQRTGTNK
ncbi:MAG: M73 family metallopeptidase [Actinobacteria bacterium]|nr:M73 family metallopeptidase [Actinomycetota bacterium]